MKKLIGILISCLLLSLIWSCDDDEEKASGGQVLAALGSKEFKTLENITPLQIPVVLSRPAATAVTVTGFIKSETGAKEGMDYTFVSKKIEIPAGKTTGYFEVELKDYPEYTPDRSFEFEVVGVEGATPGSPDLCRVIILSNEGVPRLGFVQTLQSVDEESGMTKLAVSIDRRWDKNVTFRVRVLPDKSTAVYDEHYHLDTLSVYTIPAGDTMVMVPVDIIDDIIENDTRYFEVQIYGNTGSDLSEVYRTMKVTILDDEEPIFVSFNKTGVKATESEGPVWIPVRIRGNSKVPVKVTLDVRGGTAAEGKDYTFEQRELTFPVGQKLDSVKVDFIDNALFDTDRNFQVGIAAVEGALLATTDTLITVTILNDDFNLQQLYDDLMGEWVMSSSLLDQVPAIWDVTISGGRTPEEEDENYLKKWILHAEKYVQGGWNTTLDIPMYYNVNTGEISIGFGEAVSSEVNVNGTTGVLKLGYDDEIKGDQKRQIPTTHTKDYRTIVWETGKPKFGGWLYQGDIYTGKVIFFAQNVVLTRKED